MINNKPCHSHNSDASIRALNQPTLNAFTKEAKNIIPESKVQQLVTKYQQMIDQSEVEKKSTSKRSVTPNKNGQTETNTHAISSSILMTSESERDQYGESNYSWLPLEIKLIIGEYLNLSSFNAFFATSAEYRKDPNFAQFLQNKTLLDFALKMTFQLDPQEKILLLGNIITAQIQNSDIDGAKKTAFLIDSHNRQFDQEVQKVVTAYAEKNKIAAAEEMLPLLKNALNRSQALIAISQAKAKINDKEGAKESLFLAKNEALSIECTQLSQINLLNAIALIEAKVDSIKRAKITFALSKEIVYTQSITISNDQYAGQSDRLQKIALAEFEAGDIDGAKNTLTEAEELALEIRDRIQKLKSLTAIALISIQINDKEKVKQIVLSTDGFIDKYTTLKEIAQIQINDDKEGTKETLLLARNTVLQMNDDGSFSKDYFLQEITAMQAKIGDVSNAKETVNMMENFHYKSRSLIEVALVQFKENNKKDTKKTLLLARDAALQLKMSKNKFEILTKIAQAQAQVDDIEVKNTIVSMYEVIGPEGMVHALFQIAKIQVAINNTKEVEKLFNAIRQEASSNGYSGSHDHDVVLEIAKFQARSHNIPGAKEILHALKESAFEKNRYSLLEQIAEVQAQINDLKEAKETLLLAKNIALSIKSEGQGAIWMEQFAKIQAQIGDIEGAKKTLRDLSDMGAFSQGCTAALNVLSVLNETK